MNIQEKDIPLVRAFLEREALDYMGKGTAFVDYRMKKIEEGLKKYKKGADYLTITSLSNLGLTNRSLTITPHPWYKEGIVDITLCTCGNDYCWGTITFPNKKHTGRSSSTIGVKEST